MKKTFDASKKVQDRIENLVASYKDRYGEKPPVPWLESEFVKPLMKTRTNLENLLTYWDEYIEEKIKPSEARKQWTE